MAAAAAAIIRCSWRAVLKATLVPTARKAHRATTPKRTQASSRFCLLVCSWWDESNSIRPVLGMLYLLVLVPVPRSGLARWVSCSPDLV